MLVGLVWFSSRQNIKKKNVGLGLGCENSKIRYHYYTLYQEQQLQQLSMTSSWFVLRLHFLNWTSIFIVVVIKKI